MVPELSGGDVWADFGSGIGNEIFLEIFCTPGITVLLGVMPTATLLVKVPGLVGGVLVGILGSWMTTETILWAF